jgi:hypothetical protein
LYRARVCSAALSTSGGFAEVLDVVVGGLAAVNCVCGAGGGAGNAFVSEAASVVNDNRERVRGRETNDIEWRRRIIAPNGSARPEFHFVESWKSGPWRIRPVRDAP